MDILKARIVAWNGSEEILRGMKLASPANDPEAAKLVKLAQQLLQPRPRGFDYVFDSGSYKCTWKWDPPRPYWGLVRYKVFDLDYAYIYLLEVPDTRHKAPLFIVVAVPKADKWRYEVLPKALLYETPSFMFYDPKPWSRTSFLLERLAENNIVITEKWVLWRTRLPPTRYIDYRQPCGVPYGSKAIVRGREKPTMVLLLAVQPAYWVNTTTNPRNAYLFPAEIDWLDLVMAPATWIALRIGASPDATPQLLYTQIPRIVSDIVTEDVAAGPDTLEVPAYTPFTLRMYRAGVCRNFATSTAVFANHVLEAPVELEVAEVPYKGGLGGHEVSILVMPSTMGLKGPMKPLFDIDNDGVKDAGVIINDIGHYSLALLNTKQLGVYAYPPLMLSAANLGYNRVTLKKTTPIQYQLVAPLDEPGHLERDNRTIRYLQGYYGRFYSGVIDEVLKLPWYMKAPWMKLFEPILVQIKEQAEKEKPELYASTDTIYEDPYMLLTPTRTTPLQALKQVLEAPKDKKHKLAFNYWLELSYPPETKIKPKPQDIQRTEQQLLQAYNYLVKQTLRPKPLPINTG